MAKPLALTELQRHAIESGDVGCSAHSAKRHSIGNVTSITAMVVDSATAGGCMPFSAPAPVECAQVAIKNIATFSGLRLGVPELAWQHWVTVDNAHHPAFDGLGCSSAQQHDHEKE